MSKKIRNANQVLNNNKRKEIENSKTNKIFGSTTYSKNKKYLDKMLREYQTFCKKYFGESTPIGSMTEERMNKLLEEDDINKNIKKKNLINNKSKDIFYDILNGDNKFIFENEDLCCELPNALFFNEKNQLGNHKNSKNDYKRRSNAIIKEEKKEKPKVEEEKTNKVEDEYDDFENVENVDDNKNQKAIKIQKYFRTKRSKERIYLGYDKNKTSILWIYIDKLDSKNNITKLEIKSYSINQQKNFFFEKDIKDLLGVNFISNEDLKKRINDIVDKINIILVQNENKNNLNGVNKNINNKNKNDEEKVVDDDGEEYTF